jgi:hypothetical protein
LSVYRRILSERDGARIRNHRIDRRLGRDLTFGPKVLNSEQDNAALEKHQLESFGIE